MMSSTAKIIKDIKNFLQKNIRGDLWGIVGVFLCWKVILIVALPAALSLIPLGSQDRFLGGGRQNYSLVPQVFAWANFDGEHYLSVAIFGYKGLEQAFFPLYPKLISFLSVFTPKDDLFTSLFFSTLIGIFISHLSLLLALVLLWELVYMEFSRRVAYWTIITLLVFPTSFYFGAVYNESLFLLLSVASFYFYRHRQWFLAGIFGTVSSATRLFGALLLPVFMIDSWLHRDFFTKKLWLLIAPAGLLSYMIYLWITVGDPLAFYALQKLVGEQRYSYFVLPPQIIYRYIKMLLTVDFTSPIYQTLVLELVSGVMFLLLPIYGYFKKVPLSYVFYSLWGFFISSFQGSFSSVPRYMLVFFPVFISLAILLGNAPRTIQVVFIVVSLLLLSFETMLFLRGYWIA